MIKTFLVEYNHEFDNPIKPKQLIESFNINKLVLVYSEISDYEIEEIQKFCKIYNLSFSVSSSHNELFYTITN